MTTSNPLPAVPSEGNEKKKQDHPNPQDKPQDQSTTQSPNKPKNQSTIKPQDEREQRKKQIETFHERVPKADFDSVIQELVAAQLSGSVEGQREAFRKLQAMGEKWPTD